MKKKIILPFLFIIACINLYSQNSKTDSLLNVINNLKEDTLIIDKFIEISNYYKRNENNIAIFYAKKAIEMSFKAKYKKGLAKSSLILGDIQVDIGNYTIAENYFTLALKLSNVINNKSLIAISYDGFGTISFYQANYDTALYYTLKSMDIRNKSGDDSRKFRDYAMIGSIYGAQENYEKALEYFFFALEYAKKEINKIEIYFDIGNAYSLLGNIEKSNISLIKCYDLAVKFNRVDMVGFALGSIGENYEKVNNFEKAIEYYLLSLIKFEQHSDKPGIISANIQIGKCYYKINNNEKAILYLEKGYKIAKEIKRREDICEAANYLSKAYYGTSQYKKAFNYKEEYENIQDSINIVKTDKVLKKLHTFDEEKKENTIKSLYQENKIKTAELKNSKYRFILLIGGTFILIAVFFVIIWYIRLKNKQRTVQLQQKLLRSQMNPHFIFNSLTAIQSFIIRKQDGDASKYLTSFSKLMRNILECSLNEYIKLEKEFETISDYLNLQSILNSENNIKYQIEISPELDTESILIPPMLAQPFIENSIKHGQLGLYNQGVIIVRFSKNTNDTIKIEIEDNGIGIEQSLIMKKMNNSYYRSLAMNITKERLTVLNHWTKNKIQLIITDLKHQGGKGTKISFITPFIYN